MAEIPIQKSTEIDIYEYGFDKSLNRNTERIATPAVYDVSDQTNPTQITSGILVGDLTMADGEMKSQNYVANTEGWKIDANGNFYANGGIFRGSLIAGAIDIPDTVTVNSFHVDGNGNAWWGATTLADGTAKVLSTGEATFKNVNITGGTAVTSILSGEVAQGNLNVANRGWSQTCVFSPGSSLYIKWLTGSFITADGTAYNIGDGSTGLMAARNYIYLDTGTATDVYQTTTVAADAVGAGKVLIATGINATTEAAFQTFGGIGGESILGEDIIANSITGGEIAANTITASNMNVGQLSAISADMGTLTAGNITMGTQGYIMGGQTAFNTGTGFFLGYSTDDYKLSIGSGGQDINNLNWDGTDLYVNGSKLLLSLFYGDGSDGAVVINADTTMTADMFYSTLTVNAGCTLRPAGYRIFCQNLLTNSGTIEANGGAGGITSTIAAGVQWPGGYLRGSVAGGAGSAGNDNGSNGTNATVCLGGNGGDGGDTTSHTGGTGGTSSPPSAISGGFKMLPKCIDCFSDKDVLALGGASGGGGGANDTSGSGGGAGTGGGVIVVAAKKIINHGAIQANGGDGGAGSDAANECGGGGGGGGGTVFLIYNTYSGAGTKTATGGTGGAGDNGGASGDNGTDGVVLEFQI